METLRDRNGRLPYLPPRAMQTVLGNLVTAMEHQTMRPPGGDLGIAACFAELAPEIRDTGSPISASFRDTLKFGYEQGIRPPRLGTHLASKVLRALQKPEMIQAMNGNSTYPEGHILVPERMPHCSPEEYIEEWLNTKKAWSETISKVLVEDDNLKSQFNFDLNWRKLSTNVADRGKILDLILALPGLRERFGDKPSVLEPGCSRGQIMKKILMKRIYPFSHLTVKRSLDKEFTRDERRLKTDEQLTPIINTVLTQERPFQGVGLDLWPPREKGQWLFARACLAPKELSDRERMAEYDALDQAEPEDFRYEEVDFSKPDVIIPGAEPGQFNVIFLSAVYYQLETNQKKENFLNNVMRYAAGDAVIVLVDFALPDPNNPHVIKVQDDWYAKDYQFTAAVYDLKAPEKGFQVYFICKTGRVSDIQIGPASIRFPNGKDIPVRDALLRAT